MNVCVSFERITKFYFLLRILTNLVGFNFPKATFVSSIRFNVLLNTVKVLCTLTKQNIKYRSYL